MHVDLIMALAAIEVVIAKVAGQCIVSGAAIDRVVPALPPWMSFLPLLPQMTLLAALPMPSISPEPRRTRFSTALIEFRLKVTDDSIVSRPPPVASTILSFVSDTRKVSLPVLPMSVSRPVPPSRVSLPAPPLSALLPELPISQLLPALPLPFRFAEPISCSASTLAARLTAKALWTISKPWSRLRSPHQWRR